jgi:hypothetical protein
MERFSLNSSEQYYIGHEHRTGTAKHERTDADLYELRCTHGGDGGIRSVCHCLQRKRGNLSERTRELASMRVLGFSLGETVRVVALEQLLLCMGGILFGIPLAELPCRRCSDSVASDMYAMPSSCR